MLDLWPPPLPRSEANLEAWHVHADDLIDRGRRWLGELIAVELATPPIPSPEELARFHALARPHAKERRPMIGWCLGHVRTMTIPGSYSADPSSISGELTAARELVTSPAGACLERLHVGSPNGYAQPGWRRLFAALPVSCRTVTAERIDRLDELVEALPGTVRVLDVRPWTGIPAAAVTDRFDLVELRPVWRDGDWDALLDAVARTSRVVVRLHAAPRPPVDPGPRVTFGDPDDAAILGERELRACRRPDLLDDQRRLGPIPARAQLARTTPEPHQMLWRNADGSWSHGRELVADGAQIWSSTLWLRDVDARWRQLAR